MHPFFISQYHLRKTKNQLTLFFSIKDYYMQLKSFSIILSLLAIAALPGCNTKSKESSSAGTDNTKANTDYKPAFVGQTRIKSVITTTPYKVEKLAEKLGRPWAIIPFRMED